MIAASVSVGASAVAAVVMLGPGGLAMASPTSPTASALNFNVFVEHNANLTSTLSAGPVAVGGDLTLGGTFQVATSSPGTFVAPGDGTFPSALVVGGQIDFPASTAGAILSVQNNAYAKLGNGMGAQVINVPGPTHIVATGGMYGDTPRVELTVTQPATTVVQSVIDFTTAFNDFRSSSSALATCTNNVTLADVNGRPLTRPILVPTEVHVTLTPNTTNVLNLTGAELNNITSLTFETPPSSTQPLLINVDTSADNTYDWTVPDMSSIGIAQAPFLLWNFPTASSITLPAAAATLEGTLYAPRADLVDLSPNDIEGQVITESIVMGGLDADGGEVHYAPFTAMLNCVAPTSTTTATPTARPSKSPYGRPAPSHWGHPRPPRP
ncbi:choice-of-anchor A family protein [Catellatospora tritici]|uniref:choice-of-anchor A family protein n=1 Tax=Catellatospora tritici TaxID=2851566 RepID=UPI001C2D42EB|nr:choice-of-anchor A family protein [Catellatospora tritici]MBV1852626.1 choice-of-anchor A family protein [Catellatospora tritici]